MHLDCISYFLIQVDVVYPYYLYDLSVLNLGQLFSNLNFDK